MSTYTNNSQQRAFALVEIVAGHEMSGISLDAIAKEMNCKKATIFRDLKNLEEYGWARQVGGRWALTSKATIPAIKAKKNLTTILEKVNELNKEFFEGEYK